MARTRARRSGKIGYAAPRSGKGYRLKLRCIALGLGAIGSLTCFSVSYLTTPRRVARLIAELCRPEPGMSCYDPCCGSGRLSRAAQSAASRSSGDRIRIFAQEINPIPVVAAAANRRMHDLEMTLKRGIQSAPSRLCRCERCSTTLRSGGREPNVESAGV